MAPEGGSGKTWIAIIIIAIILAAGGWWWYQSSTSGIEVTPNASNETGATGNTATNPSGGTNVGTGANGNGNVNFGTVDDLPPATSYPDVGK